MTKPLYTNGAVAKLTAPITATDLSISVDSGTNFPNPVLGEESFWMTLVGNVSQAIEIVEVSSRNGNVMSITRGQEGTTAQAFGVNDQAYHALTAADASQFRDAMRYYLGGHTTEPTVGNLGEPLEAGMLYFNTNIGEMREFNGSAWQQFAAIVSIAGLVESVWDNHAGFAGGQAIPWDDDILVSDNGNKSPQFDSNLSFTVFVNGAKLLNADDPPAGTGGADGFKVSSAVGPNYTYTVITFLQAVPALAEIVISFADSVSGGYIAKEDEFASDWGALGTQAEINAGTAGKLADGETLKSYADAGDAAQQAYSDNVETNSKAYADAGIAAHMTGFKNVLINSDFRIDQRGVWLGNWANVAEGKFGPDRWKKFGTKMIQTIEKANTKIGLEYTLSWTDGGSGDNGLIVDGDGTTLATGASGISATFTDQTNNGGQVSVPIDAINIQLELGGKVTPLEIRNNALELLMCKRFYHERTVNQVGVQVSSTELDNPTINFPVKMHRVPTITLTSISDVLNEWEFFTPPQWFADPASLIGTTDVQINVRLTGGTFAPGSAYKTRGKYTADAEIL